jgi:hypothetical protein
MNNLEFYGRFLSLFKSCNVDLSQKYISFFCIIREISLYAVSKFNSSDGCFVAGRADSEVATSGPPTIQPIIICHYIANKNLVVESRIFPNGIIKFGHVQYFV